MKRTLCVLSLLLLALAVSAQAMEPVETRPGHTPPQPRDGSGTDTVVVPILIYHSIRPYNEHDTPAVKAYIATPETLERELSSLKEGGYTSVTPDQLADALTAGTALPEHPIIITFDDSWLGQYTYALPLLKKYGFTATFYTWVYMVGRRNHMTWDEIRALAQAGMQIGCHTMTHPYLTKNETDAALRWEILGAKTRIEQETGVRVTSFAYPFGQYDARVVSFVQEAGFTTARSTWPGVTHSRDGLLSLTGLIRTESAPALEIALSTDVSKADEALSLQAETDLGGPQTEAVITP